MALEQSSLRRSRPPEFCGVQTVALTRVQTQPPAGNVKAIAQQLGKLPFPLHAAAEVRIVVAPAAHVANARHDVLGLERIVPLEPALEKILHFPRKPQHGVAGHSRPGVLRGSKVRAISPSSDPMETNTCTSPSRAMGSSTSRSRSISEPLVTMPTGLRNSQSTSRMPRVILCFRSTG